MASPGDLASEPLVGWANKVRTNVVRLAAVLFLSDFEVPLEVDPDARISVGAECMERAIEIANYCLAQAKSVFQGMAMIPSDVEVALGWLQTSGATTFRARDLQRARQATFKRASQVQVVVEALLAAGAIRPTAPNKRGRPADSYEVHPDVSSHVTK